MANRRTTISGAPRCLFIGAGSAHCHTHKEAVGSEAERGVAVSFLPLSIYSFPCSCSYRLLTWRIRNMRDSSILHVIAFIYINSRKEGNIFGLDGENVCHFYY